MRGYRCEYCGGGVNPQGDAVVWRHRDMAWFDGTYPHRIVYVWHPQCFRNHQGN